MLNAEQTAVVRQRISRALNIDESRVVPGARLFADLGATAEHLKPLRLAIEEAIGVQIEPVVNPLARAGATVEIVPQKAASHRV